MLIGKKTLPINFFFSFRQLWKIKNVDLTKHFMEIEISCPKCNWTPEVEDYWICDCDYVWNTFETFGECPNCKKVWSETQCPENEYDGGCGSWSNHLDWYRNLDEFVSKELKETLSEPIEITKLSL
jgi:hypothetical protein